MTDCPAGQLCRSLYCHRCLAYWLKRKKVHFNAASSIWLKVVSSSNMCKGMSISGISFFCLWILLCNSGFITWEQYLSFILQRLISVSPNLPKLISSMNVQPPKENEIVLLSGLASGNLQADYEVPQVGIKLIFKITSYLWRVEFRNWKKGPCTNLRDEWESANIKI